MINSTNNGLRIAVFDIDKTLLLETSAEVQLIRFLYKEKIIRASDLFRSLFYSLSQIFRGFDTLIYSKSRYLKGVEQETINAHLPRFFDAYIWPRISSEILDYLQQLKKKNYKIIFISGTLDFLLSYFIEKYDVDGGVGSHMEVDQEKYSGHITGIYPYKYGKIKALEYYLDGRKIDYESSYAFADSVADIPLLKLFGNPVVVNPSVLLWIKAKRSKWKIIKVK